MHAHGDAIRAVHSMRTAAAPAGHPSVPHAPPGACQRELQELARGLVRHAEQAQELARLAADRNWDSRIQRQECVALLEPLTAFSASLMDMHHLVRDAMSSLASQCRQPQDLEGAADTGAPIETPSLERKARRQQASLPQGEASSPSQPRQLKQPAHQPKRGAKSPDLRAKQEHGELLFNKLTAPFSNEFQCEALRLEEVSCHTHAARVGKCEQEELEGSDCVEDDACRSEVHSEVGSKSRHPDLLEFVGGLLRRKRKLLMQEGGSDVIGRLRELDEDIARVNLELEGAVDRTPDRTPQKELRCQANSDASAIAESVAEGPRATESDDLLDGVVLEQSGTGPPSSPPGQFSTPSPVAAPVRPTPSPVAAPVRQQPTLSMAPTEPNPVDAQKVSRYDLPPEADMVQWSQESFNVLIGSARCGTDPTPKAGAARVPFYRSDAILAAKPDSDARPNESASPRGPAWGILHSGDDQQSDQEYCLANDSTLLEPDPLEPEPRCTTRLALENLQAHDNSYDAGEEAFTSSEIVLLGPNSPCLMSGQSEHLWLHDDCSAEYSGAQAMPVLVTPRDKVFSAPTTPRGKENTRPGIWTPPQGLGDRGPRPIKASPQAWCQSPAPPTPWLGTTPSTTPSRRVAASFGSSGLFRETPSPRPGLARLGGSPFCLSRCVSASPSRYDDDSATKTPDVMSLAHAASSCSAAASSSGGIPPGQGVALGSWASPAGSFRSDPSEGSTLPLRTAVSTPGRLSARRSSSAPSLPRSPAGVAGPHGPAPDFPSPVQVPSPARAAAASTPGRVVRSPSAPVRPVALANMTVHVHTDLRGNRMGIGTKVGTVAVDDMPGNHTDWRRSLQMARGARQDGQRQGLSTAERLAAAASPPSPATAAADRPSPQRRLQPWR